MEPTITTVTTTEHRKIQPVQQESPKKVLPKRRIQRSRTTATRRSRCKGSTPVSIPNAIEFATASSNRTSSSNSSQKGKSEKFDAVLHPPKAGSHSALSSILGPPHPLTSYPVSFLQPAGQLNIKTTNVAIKSSPTITSPTAPSFRTFDYFMSHLPPPSLPSDNESDDDDASFNLAKNEAEKVEEGIEPSSITKLPQTEGGAIYPDDAEAIRRRAKAILEKDGFYDWSHRKVIEDAAAAKQQLLQQNQKYEEGGAAHGYSNVVNSSSAESSAAGTPAPVLSQATSTRGGEYKSPQSSGKMLHRTASGRVTRSMVGSVQHIGSPTTSDQGPVVKRGPSSLSSSFSLPFGALTFDAKQAAADRKAMVRTRQEKHRWALRDLRSAANMLEDNLRQIENFPTAAGIMLGGGGSGSTVAERRDSMYKRLAMRHVEAMRKMEKEWEELGRTHPKELGAFRLGEYE